MGATISSSEVLTLLDISAGDSCSSVYALTTLCFGNGFSAKLLSAVCVGRLEPLSAAPRRLPGTCRNSRGEQLFQAEQFIQASAGAEPWQALSSTQSQWNLSVPH